MTPSHNPYIVVGGIHSSQVGEFGKKAELTVVMVLGNDGWAGGGVHRTDILHLHLCCSIHIYKRL